MGPWGHTLCAFLHYMSYHCTRLSIATTVSSKCTVQHDAHTRAPPPTHTHQGTPPAAALCICAPPSLHHAPVPPATLRTCPLPLHCLMHLDVPSHPQLPGHRCTIDVPTALCISGTPGHELPQHCGQQSTALPHPPVGEGEARGKGIPSCFCSQNSARSSRSVGTQGLQLNPLMAACGPVTIWTALVYSTMPTLWMQLFILGILHFLAFLDNSEMKGGQVDGGARMVAPEWWPPREFLLWS